MVMQRPNPAEEGGSIPTYPLHIQTCRLADIREFIERWHYSHSTFGITGKYFFSVRCNGELTGAAIFGAPAAYNIASKYAPDGAPLVELRRFCMVDELPKNSESRALGVMFRALRKQGVTRIISYADPAHGHVGTIYKATGFKYIGLTAKRKHIMWKGKKYPDRNLHQVHFPFHKELRAAVEDGSATRVPIPGKHIYLKEFT
jgi:hypothetical protein